jgi:hypothetical protein
MAGFAEILIEFLPAETHYDKTALHARPSCLNRSSSSTWCISSGQVTTTRYWDSNSIRGGCFLAGLFLQTRVDARASLLPEKLQVQRVRRGQLHQAVMELVLEQQQWIADIQGLSAWRGTGRPLWNFRIIDR